MSALPSSVTLLRTRPVAAGHWRAFLAVARHLNFRAAAEELALTQSAVSRQIQALEDEVGLPLFLRHTRAVELTGAGAQLQRTVAPALERIDAAVRLVRQTAGRKSVAIATWASFASTWLIPRMEAFQRDHPATCLCRRHRPFGAVACQVCKRPGKFAFMGRQHGGCVNRLVVSCRGQGAGIEHLERRLPKLGQLRCSIPTAGAGKDRRNTAHRRIEAISHHDVGR